MKKKCKQREISTSRFVNYHFEITSTNQEWNAHFFVFWSTFTCPFCLFELHFFKIRSTFYSEQTWKDWLQLHLPMYLQHYHCKGHILPEHKSNLRYNLLIFRVKKLKILCIYFSGKQPKSKRIIIIKVGIIFTDY